ncbi:hypothetical protein N7462_004227 [Penicillium macrosclerotiorum]|uniref:uncharacterized protein n=1 Tax=Penicillium macrosclerotiorum TaxID=303699 RepID=UPI002546F664|nr:uncharacterized protein N7462_004227 [Penicillium macrosclerotiorum]KAJ5689835.1 hypothetical protein N7462_004227 [Penicillium macrosclerotiorum]
MFQWARTVIRWAHAFVRWFLCRAPLISAQDEELELSSEVPASIHAPQELSVLPPLPVPEDPAVPEPLVEASILPTLPIETSIPSAVPADTDHELEFRDHTQVVSELAPQADAPIQTQEDTLGVSEPSTQSIITRMPTGILLQVANMVDRQSRFNLSRISRQVYRALSRSPPGLGDVPVELFLEICYRVDNRALYHLARTCRSFHTHLISSVRRNTLNTGLTPPEALQATYGYQDGIRPGNVEPAYADVFWGRPNALVQAVIRDDTDTAWELLHHGADPNLPNASGMLPLLFNAYMGSLPMTELLLEFGAHPCQMNPVPPDRPMDYAVRAGLETMVRRFIRAGNISPCISDVVGDIIRNSEVETIELAMEVGEIDFEHVDAKCLQDTQQGVLHCTAVRNDSTIMNLVLPHLPISVINTENGLGENALQFAIEMSKLNVWRIVAQIPGLNINHQSHNGTSVLMSAIERGNLVAADWLLDHGAQVNKHKRTGENELHCAIARHQLAIIPRLLEKGTDINMLAFNRGTPLHYAVRTMDLELVRLLLSTRLQTADLTIVDESLGHDVISESRFLAESMADAVEITDLLLEYANSAAEINE